ncbi:MAG: Fe-S protein assembly co-chaperone HscB [Acidobacteria bacterium]|nr:Fe-S protein assembly co-chaperone HscB [Acidobacteriota bacterium]
MATYFEALGIAPRLSVDPEALRAAFYQRSRELHPDRFARADREQQARALELSSLLNDGFRTLRDPVSRAEYLLKLNGFDIGEQRSKDVPPELLEEVFELNMAMEELKAGDEHARGPLEEARRKFSALVAGTDETIDGLFASWDASQSRDDLARIRAALNRRRYLSNLLRDAEKALAPES